jgi:pyridoxal phosphate enzyme (YggS family)
VTLSSSTIAIRRDALLGRIAQAALKARRNPQSVSILAVTKTQPADVVRSAARAGLTLFGENRVAEGIAKIEALRTEFPGLVWRLIGPLQSNKARAALQWFAMVETLDRERLASRMAALLPAGGDLFPVLLEVNVAGEATKAGVPPEAVERLARAAIATGRLAVRGLMTVPPFDPDPEAARPHFRRLRELRDRLADRLAMTLPELSMGMSHDFEVAVEEGSTEVRIGTALFGEREAAQAQEQTQA